MYHVEYSTYTNRNIYVLYFHSECIKLNPKTVKLIKTDYDTIYIYEFMYLYIVSIQSRGDLVWIRYRGKSLYILTFPTFISRGGISIYQFFWGENWVVGKSSMWHRHYLWQASICSRLNNDNLSIKVMRAENLVYEIFNYDLKSINCL